MLEFLVDFIDEGCVELLNDGDLNLLLDLLLDLELEEEIEDDGVDVKELK